MIRAYEEQFEAIEARRLADHPDGEPRARPRRAIRRRLPAGLRPAAAQAREPVIIHWLGDMFDPQLAGYWGSADVAAAMATALAVIAAHPEKVDGIKISLLDAASGDRDAPPPAARRPHVYAATTSTSPT